jgi:hypothetical protein
MIKAIEPGDVTDNLSATFTTETSKATGKDERSVRRDAERGEAHICRRPLRRSPGRG